MSELREPDLPRTAKVRKGPLRSGWTTGTCSSAAAKVKEHKLYKHTLVLVGPALGSGGTRSHLYHPGHFHEHRKVEDKAARLALKERDASLR